MKSERCQEAEDFKKVFKENFKSDLVDLIKSTQEGANDQESTEKVDSRGLQLIQTSELPDHYSSCNMCDFKSMMKKDLKRHIKQLHTANADSLKMWVCNTCELKFAKAQSLENHVKSQHLNEKHFSCSSCDYKSYYKQSVETHIIRKHKGSKMTKMNKLDCSNCMSNINQISSDVFKSPFQPLLVCKFCEYETKKTSYLKRHSELKHRPNAEPSNVLTCPSCEFETEKQKLLQLLLSPQFSEEVEKGFLRKGTKPSQKVYSSFLLLRNIPGIQGCRLPQVQEMQSGRRAARGRRSPGYVRLQSFKFWEDTFFPLQRKIR